VSLIARSTRSGVMGRWVSRTPTASYMAFAMAEAVGHIADSAAPLAP